jgi:hypothetical protein
MQLILQKSSLHKLYLCFIMFNNSLKKKINPKNFDRITFIQIKSNFFLKEIFYYHSYYSVQTIIFFLQFQLRYFKLQLKFRLYSYFRWLKISSKRNKVPLLLHFFFAFCKITSSHITTKGTFLIDGDAIVSKSLNSNSYFRSDVTTISRGPMARKKWSRDQSFIFFGTAENRLYIKLNLDNFGFKLFNTFSAKQHINWFSSSDTTNFQFNNSNSKTIFWNCGLYSYFSSYESRILPFNTYNYKKISNKFKGIYFFLQLSNFLKKQQFSIESPISQMYATFQLFYFFDIFFFALNII